MATHSSFSDSFTAPAETARFGALFWQLTATYPDAYRQLGALLCDPVYRNPPGPKVSGQPVLLIPGFLAGDWTLQLLAGWLSRMGYNPYFSGLDWNVDCPNRTGHLLRWRLNQIIRETGRPLIVFGHSLGGMLARFLGANFPDQVRYVVTMGSPIQRTENVSPLVLFASRVLQPFRRWRGELPPECGTLHCNCHFNRSVISPLPQEVGFTSIFSKQDEVVEWNASIDPHRENREVTGRHIGLIVNPQVYRVLTDILSRLQQEEGNRELTGAFFSE